MNDFRRDLRATAAEVAALEPEDIGTHDKLLDDLGLDSIMLLDLLATLSGPYPQLVGVAPAETNINDDSTFGQLEATFLSIVDPDHVSGQPGERPRVGVESLPAVQTFRAFLHELGETPYFRPHDGVAGRQIRCNGADAVNFASYNYLGTNGLPEIVDEAAAAMAVYGTSVSAARIISGEIPLHGTLERELAEFVGAEAALVQVGGHSTNVNVIGNILTDEDLILHDALAHNSIIQGAEMSAAKRKPFRHNDATALRRELNRVRGKFRHVLVVVEGVYSMDGDICDLPGILAATEEYDCYLMIDEAHSLGTIGDAGRGVTSHFGIDPRRVDILMGTLSKSLNSCGGYVAGHADFIEYLRYNLPGFVFSVGMTPGNTAAALASLRVCRDNPEWIPELADNAERLRKGFAQIGLDTGDSEGTPIVPFIVGDSGRSRHIAAELYARGVNVDPITYPAVKEQESRLRFFVSRAHTDEDLQRTLDAIREVVGS